MPRALIALAAAALAAVLPMQNAKASPLQVVTDPPGAILSIDGIPLGLSPFDGDVTIALDSLLRVQLRDYQAVQQPLAAGAGPIRLAFHLTRATATITVTTLADPPLASDGTMSLRKALAIAGGDWTVAGAESLCVDGRAGPDSPTVIRFQPGLVTADSVMVLNSPLPPLDRPGHVLEGPGRQLVLMPAPGTTGHPGLMLGAGVSASHLSLDGFDVGVAALGGNGNTAIEDVAISGVLVGVVGTEKAAVTLNGTTIDAAFAASLTTGGSVITGTPPIPPKVADTASIAPIVGGGPLLMLTGSFAHEDRPPALYVRNPQRMPLVQVPGITAESSSYAAFRVFNAEGMQEWAINAVTGKGDFRWELGSRPLENEFMNVNFARPVRLSSLTIHRMVEAENQLLAYRVSLFDGLRHRLASFDVTTAPAADDKGDAIKVDLALDVATIEIRPVKVIGTGPAISSIEAELLDGPEYTPLAWSSDRIVFPRPEPGTAPLLRIGSHFYALPDSAIASSQTLTAIAPASGFQSRGTGTVISVTDGGDQPTRDGRLTLREAIRIANGDRPPSDAEKKSIAGSGNPIVIAVQVAEVTLSSPLPAITARQVAITSSGTVIRTMSTAAVWIEDSGSEAFELGGVTLGGSVRARRAGSVVLRNVNIAAANAVGVDADASVLMISGSRIANGGVGVVASGEAEMIDNHFERLEVGIRIPLNHAQLLLGNEFDATKSPLDATITGDDARPWMILAGNHAPTGSTSRIITASGAAATDLSARPTLAAANQPPLLGLPQEIASSAAATDPGLAIFDLRRSADVPAIHFIDYDDPQGRLLIAASGERPIEVDRSFVALLFDRPIIVWYVGAHGSDRRVLVPPGSQTEARDNLTARNVSVAAIGSVAVGTTTRAAASPQLAMETHDLSGGEKIPAPFPADSVQRTVQQVATLVDRHQEEAALIAALSAASRWPSASEIVDAVVYAADHWSDTVPIERADALMAALERRFVGDPRIGRLEVVVLNRQGLKLAEKHDWAAALERFDRLLRRVPDDQTGKQNIIYTYQEWGKERLQQQDLDTVLVWLDEARKSRPQIAAQLAELADGIAEEAAHAAYDKGDMPRAVDLYARLYAAAPNDDRRKQNLLAAIQKSCTTALASGDMKAALTVARGERQRFAALPGIDQIVVSAFGSAIDSEMRAGRGDAALNDAIAVAQAFPNGDAEQLLAYAAQSELNRLAGTNGFDVALAQWEALHKQFPNAAPVTAAAVAAVNNEAIRLDEAGQHQAAIDLFHRGLAMSPDPQLRNNLRVTYINWAVGLVNAGKAKDAVPILERAKAEFGADPDIDRVLAAARQRAG